MGHDTGIADRLRAQGVRVTEVDGWQTRGSSSFTPRGSVNHHTAGGANGTCPSLNTCIYGRSDLPGPLCNVLQSREDGAPDIAYVIAAGRANHAGEGGYGGLSGNSSVYGLEIEHTGTSSISEGRRQTAAAIHAAMIRGAVGGPDPNAVCQHSEWTSRKIDLATEVDPDGFRGRVRDALAGGGGGGGPEEPFTMGQYEDIIDRLGRIEATMAQRPVAIQGVEQGPAQHKGVWLSDGIHSRWVPSLDHIQFLLTLGQYRMQPWGEPYVMLTQDVDAVPEVYGAPVHE
jgi:hypothetical protein